MENVIEADPLLVSWHSYPSIFALGHRSVKEIFSEPVAVEEKIDGSQISFGLFRDGYRVRSKGAELNIFAPDKMFSKAVEVIKTLPLTPGWTYRGEYLAKPKHNALAYDRTPKNHIILFDVNTGRDSFLNPADKAAEAERIGLEAIPNLCGGETTISDPATFRTLLSLTSCLGGQHIEGVVIKNYHRFGGEGVLIGKFVSESFKEVHGGAWKEKSDKKDFMTSLIEKYKTPARWAKAVQHLREAGVIEDSPKDIGKIMGEVWPDIEKECKEDIKDALYDWAQTQLRRGVVAGIPEWYKDQLLQKQFDTAEPAAPAEVAS